jgi:hypothetical protein
MAVVPSVLTAIIPAVVSAADRLGFVLGPSPWWFPQATVHARIYPPVSPDIIGISGIRPDAQSTNGHVVVLEDGPVAVARVIPTAAIVIVRVRSAGWAILIQRDRSGSR